jgi:methylated-DNA-[protein]-cysteine S-methyltransferase
MAFSNTTLFHTAFGPCAIGWNAAAIVRVVLPPASAFETSSGGLNRDKHPIPDFVREAIAAITRHLNGDLQPLEDHPIGIAEASAFSQAVWREARTIPMGETRSYRDLARALNAPGAARAVGRALGANPVPLLVPCHRIIASNGKLGGFSAEGGASLKAKILALESAGRLL